MRVKNSSVNNYTGIISSTNDITLESKNVLDNQRGMIRSTTGNVVMKATNMNSVGSYIAGKNVTIESAVDINSKYSLIAATEQLNLKAGEQSIQVLLMSLIIMQASNLTSKNKKAV